MTTEGYELLAHYSRELLDLLRDRFPIAGDARNTPSGSIVAADMCELIALVIATRDALPTVTTGRRVVAAVHKVRHVLQLIAECTQLPDEIPEGGSAPNLRFIEEIDPRWIDALAWAIPRLTEQPGAGTDAAAIFPTAVQGRDADRCFKWKDLGGMVQITIGAEVTAIDSSLKGIGIIRRLIESPNRFVSAVGLHGTVDQDDSGFANRGEHSEALNKLGSERRRIEELLAEREHDEALSEDAPLSSETKKLHADLDEIDRDIRRLTNRHGKARLIDQQAENARSAVSQNLARVYAKMKPSLHSYFAHSIRPDGAGWTYQPAKGIEWEF